jgi:hypothetical protein
VHPRTGRPAPAADVVAALLDHVRPALADAGDEQRVADGVAALLRRGTGADLQRRVHEETGDLAAVVRAAVEVTAGNRPDGTGRPADRLDSAPCTRRAGATSSAATCSARARSRATGPTGSSSGWR